MKSEVDKNKISELVVKKISSIGIKVRAKRKEMGFTQLDLAFFSCSDTSVISEIERGVASGMTLCTLIKIASVLEISEDELFCEYFLYFCLNVNR